MVMPPDPAAMMEQPQQPTLPGMEAAPQAAQGIQRTPPADIPESRRQAVGKLVSEVQQDKAHWERDFKQMREDMNFSRGWQWPDQMGWEDDRYTANIVQRHINQRVSALYAKNPTFTARRRERLDFAIWDESPASMQQAMAAVDAAMQDPAMAQGAEQAQALLQDVQQGAAKRRMYDNIARTLELIWSYYVGEQAVPFKLEMKQMVRRAITCGVAYVKLGYQRAMEPRPEIVNGIADAAERLAHLQALVADAADDKIAENQAEMEELRKTLEALQAEPEIISREGPIFDYPQSWSIIPDRRCKQLKGFIGCKRVTQEYMLTPQEVKEIYGIDLGESYSAYQYAGSTAISPVKLQAMGRHMTGETLACVYEVYERESATVCTVCEGWPDYLREPAPPSPSMERFWPFFVLSFNDGEHETRVFPVSDVQLLKPMQQEYNRCREGLRRHRIANRPKTVTAHGMLSEEDADNLKTHPDNAIIELQGMQPGQKVDELLQPWRGPTIDPALYDTDLVFQDVLRVVGSQEANLGGTSSSTATESSIAESSRLSSLQSNIDDLDDFLTELGRAGGQVCLLELAPETVKRIVGDGAVWPDISRTEVAEELFLQVEAGSSGRPNKAQEMQNLNMLLPYLLQIPGIQPHWLAEQVLRRLDDRLDLTDAIVQGVPSITAQNAVKQPESAAAPEDAAGEGTQAAEGEANAPQPGAGAQGNASPTIPRTRPPVAVPANVAGRGSA